MAMKRGKDDEKILEPLFPRLHVNDADKGGPRAPPRNKMALYEQLSIPSQRSNHQGMVPFSASHTSNLFPPGPSDQVCRVERNLYSHHQMTTSATVHPAGKVVARKSCVSNLRSFARNERRKFVGEEDAFMVSVFLNTQRLQSHDRTKNSDSVDLSAREETNVRKSASKSERVRQEHVMRLDQNENCSGHRGPDKAYNDNQHLRRNEEDDGVSETSMVDSISSTEISPDEVVSIIGQKRFWKARRAIANQQRVFAVQVFELHRLIKVQRLIAASPHLLIDERAFLGKSSLVSSPIKKLLNVEYLATPLPRVANHNDDSEKDNCHQMEGSAENAVGRTISVSSGINHSSGQHHPPAAPNGTETQMTLTTGGGGGGGGDSGGGSWCFPPQPYPGNHQWLIPIMSPSEGLVYKPYPSPGLVGSVCGGYYGHFMPAPMSVNNFTGGPAYGVPTPSPYHPGVGFPPSGPQSFFPHGMPSMNPNFPGQSQHTEPMNPVSHPENNAQQQSSCNFPSSNNNANIAAEMQTKTQPQPTKIHPWNREKSRVGQESTRSSRGERGGSAMEISSTNALPVFPTADKRSGNKRLMTATATTTTDTTTITMTTAAAAAATNAEAATRVIRVVPHNPKAASESVARIFRSIQQERQHNESSV